MKVHLGSYPERESEELLQILRGAYECSDKTHSIVGDPHSADVILIAGIGNAMPTAAYLKLLVRHELISRFPQKSFTTSFRDQPFVLNRGLFQSPVSGFLASGRVMACPYFAHQFCDHVRKRTETDVSTNTPDLLFSFIGRDSHPIRNAIFSLRPRRTDIHIEDSSQFNFWNRSDKSAHDRGQTHYYQTLLRSKFSLCPRGAGSGSIRLFESMRSGICPIIVSDEWIAPSVIDWSRCSIRIKERHIGELEHIVSQHEESFRQMGAEARAEYFRHFSEGAVFNYLIAGCASLQRTGNFTEALHWRARHLHVFRRRLFQRLRRLRDNIG